MATHSSILARRNPRTEELGRPQSIGSQRVRHDCSDLACTQAPDDKLSLGALLRYNFNVSDF